MAGPEKPFSCSASGCGESFTNEDRLAVHARRHDMDLQLETKGVTFVADQTPTPTRFIRNCEEVGLFQDLQNVNPFEETFKRAMETRSGVSHHHLTLDENLVTTDDTLHTPHIFPHLPDENAPTTIYTNAERRSELNVNRQSSDEGSDQLNKSMSSSVEDNLTSVCLQDTTDKHSNSIDKKMAAFVGRKIFKRMDKGSTKLKTLIRQRSVDIEDINSSSVVMDADINLRIRKSDINIDMNSSKGGLTSDDNMSMRTLQIPIISISETSKVDDDDRDLNSREDLQVVLKKDLLIANTVKESNKLDIKATVKQNFSKIISQRSIDLALIHFENESKNKTMDLNNISIEDMPESMDDQSSVLIKGDSLCDDNGGSHLSERSLKRHNFKMTENKCISIHGDEGAVGVFQQSNIINRIESVNESITVINDGNPSDIPSVEMIGGKILSESQENNAKGYELLLKWPDGKKVYLKEVFREVDSQNDLNKASVIIEGNEIVENSVVQNSNTSNVKQRLKEVIQSNAKQRSVASYQITKNDRNSPKIAINNLHVRPKSATTLPENYVLFPQATQNGIPTMVRNNIQLLAKQPQTNQPIIFANNNFGEILSHDSSKQIPFNQNIAEPNNFYSSGSIETFKGKFNSTDSPLTVNLLPKISNNSHSEIITSSLTNSNDASKICNGDQLNFKGRKRKVDKEVLVSNVGKEMSGKDEFACSENTEKRNKKETSKSSDAQERNRAAVLRYRTKKEAMNKMVKAKNEMLEDANQKLNEKLSQAMQEVRRLRAVLASHVDCSVSKAKGNSQILEII